MRRIFLLSSLALLSACSGSASSAEATKYHWFQGASVQELTARLQSAGPDSARLEVRTSGDSMFFRVVGPSTKALAAKADIDESHACPPSCP